MPHPLSRINVLLNSFVSQDALLLYIYAVWTVQAYPYIYLELILMITTIAGVA